MDATPALARLWRPALLCALALSGLAAPASAEALAYSVSGGQFHSVGVFPGAALSFDVAITLRPEGKPVSYPVSVTLAKVLPAKTADSLPESWLDFSPASMAFSGPGDVRTVRVTVAVPSGTPAGDYGAKVKAIPARGSGVGEGAGIDLRVRVAVPSDGADEPLGQDPAEQEGTGTPPSEEGRDFAEGPDNGDWTEAPGSDESTDGTSTEAECPGLCESQNFTVETQGDDTAVSAQAVAQASGPRPPSGGGGSSGSSMRESVPAVDVARSPSVEESDGLGDADAPPNSSGPLHSPPGLFGLPDHGSIGETVHLPAPLGAASISGAAPTANLQALGAAVLATLGGLVFAARRRWAHPGIS